MSLHRLLDRQIRRAGLDSETLADARMGRLLESVSRAYDDADQERYLHERSLTMASQEMRELYESTKVAGETRLSAIVDSASDIIYTIDLQGRFTSLNSAAYEISGYEPGELIGAPFTKVVAAEYVPEIMSAMQAKMKGAEIRTRYAIEVLTKAGERIPLELASHIVYLPGRQAEILGIGRDMRDRRERDRLDYLAHHDPLTGLPNRYVLEPLLRQAAEHAGTGKHAFFLLLDLDNFKVVNDTVGHVGGDRVLVEATNLLRGHLAPADVLARMGGDEFAVVLSDATEEQSQAVAAALRGALTSADVEVAGHSFAIGASIGIAEVHAGDDPADVMARADTAMYQAKHLGRNRSVVSQEGDRAPAFLAKAHEWVRQIRSAIEAGRVIVHYQPVVDLQTRLVTHHEALVRLADPTGRLHSPQQFVPAAEQWGVMPQLDRVVFDTVLAGLRENPERQVFVNLSALSIADGDLLAHIDSALAGAEGVARRFGVEVTETAVLRDFDAARAWMERLKQHGVRFALDDFGVGFSSLAYIRDLPFDQLKIDGSFVREIAGQPRLYGMVRAIKALADVLEVDAVAESIENARVFEAALQLGIRYGQGYYLGAPAAAERILVRAA
ncbi:MAG: putative bifunctional diguanylate cyclase/phosphodiesterase [Dehalococcoidia bacterium]